MLPWSSSSADKEEKKTLSSGGGVAKNKEHNQQQQQQQHRKRLAQILRYIASMHQSLENNNNNNNNNNSSEGGGENNNNLFVRCFHQQQQPRQNVCLFFQRETWIVVEDHRPHSNNNNEQDDLEDLDNTTATTMASNNIHNNNDAVLFSIENFAQLVSMTGNNDTVAGALLFTIPPFSFYAATTTTTAGGGMSSTLAVRGGSNTTTSNRKRLFSSATSSGGGGSAASITSSSNNNNNNKPCWFRITRLTNTQVGHPPPIPHHPEVRRYLQEWMLQSQQSQAQSTIVSSSTSSTSIYTFLNRRGRLEQAPKVSPTTVSMEGIREIKSFLRQYKRYLRRKLYQQHLEPIYNALFEWIQSSQQSGSSSHHTMELVWGLGHVFYQFRNDDNDDDDEDDGGGGITVVNGPVLEVLVEVELARDGALLVRPREHTSVTLNRSVMEALRRKTAGATATSRTTTTLDPQQQQESCSNSSTTTGMTVWQQLHRTVAELEPTQLSPGQPNTYIPILKRIAMELSSGGSYQPYTTTSMTGIVAANEDPNNNNKLTITEAWCLYTRNKPSSVWARDANAFADQLMRANITSDAASSSPSFYNVPQATWALTHGPSYLNFDGGRNPSSNFPSNNNGVFQWIGSMFFSAKQTAEASGAPTASSPDVVKPLFPLASSDAQNRIADLLLNKNYPAVVCEGPPGTGKTQTIANMICAYLCQGKRVLVTSKNAPALSVIRTRLPVAVQELCVDVSMSESTGVRQLQLTVERLSNRLTSHDCDLNREKYLYLQKSIQEHRNELNEIDEKIRMQCEHIRQLVQHPDGQELVERSIELLDEVPWLMSTIAKWTVQEVTALLDHVASLAFETGDPALDVTGFAIPVSTALLSLVMSKAGGSVASVSNAAQDAISSLPLIGSFTGMQERRRNLEEALSQIRVLDGETVPMSQHDWMTVWRAMKKRQALFEFKRDVWNMYQRKDSWPGSTYLNSNVHVQALYAHLEVAVKVKKLCAKLDVESVVNMATQCRALDAKRSVLSLRIQSLSEELVNATVVAELSRSFSNEAHSALIRFSQIAGKAKFNKSQLPSKMTVRQRRRRQDYLDAFDKCCRFIPCWILTTSQISDFLPPECLFDLVINDETSQSDITVLPGMLRGKQWLIVGDGKQVSPTESFVSEDQIESLRAALPACSLESALLPGQSFFDLCSQAFPAGRVVLNEHFRCASEIIAFSNEQFYDNQLVPLRLPKKSERITPSIVDVQVRNGTKNGKINEKEAEEIVNRVQRLVSDPSFVKRTIGIISLMGDEQSRLIRGRLLDTIGPHLMARHDVLVGDPTAFQGAERDVIFLSMVCSRGKAPVQSQQFHFQRANVALSRARDLCVLVRSIEISEIPSMDDVKIPILEFFISHSNDSDATETSCSDLPDNIHPAQRLLAKSLTERGYVVRSMGVIWKNGLCIEHPHSDMRAALLVDCIEYSTQEWSASYRQQKAIERVGWKCLRIAILAFLTDNKSTMATIIRFLSSAGVEPPTKVYEDIASYGAVSRSDDAPLVLEEQDDDVLPDEEPQVEAHPEQMEEDQLDEHLPVMEPQEIVVVSSDEEGGMEDTKPRARDTIRPDDVVSSSSSWLDPTAAAADDDNDDVLDASQFGHVVDLGFLTRGRQQQRRPPVDAYDDDASSSRRAHGSAAAVAVPRKLPKENQTQKRRRTTRPTRTTTNRLDENSETDEDVQESDDDPTYQPDDKA